jgi:cell fate regulator YaaT (PSP1 superfamily)
MCCLKYEHPLYAEFRERAPRLGAEVDSPHGPGTVAGHNVPSDRVIVKLSEDGRRCACSRASVCGPRQAYEGAHGPGPGTT